MQVWLFWNSLHRPGCPGLRDPTCLRLWSPGIEGVCHHHIQPNVSNFRTESISPADIVPCLRHQSGSARVTQSLTCLCNFSILLSQILFALILAFSKCCIDLWFDYWISGAFLNLTPVTYPSLSTHPLPAFPGHRFCCIEDQRRLPPLPGSPSPYHTHGAEPVMWRPYQHDGTRHTKGLWVGGKKTHCRTTIHVRKANEATRAM